MGTKVASTYATFTIGYLEQKSYERIEDIFGLTFKREFISSWKRFLDDCFISWTKSKADLDNLKNMLNTLHEYIKFTVESNVSQLPFLDCFVIKRNTGIETDIFYKPTDSKTYLLFTSSHPKHSKISIPFSLARRLRTIISEEETFTKHTKELEQLLLKQKYPKTLIKAGIYG